MGNHPVTGFSHDISEVLLRAYAKEGELHISVCIVSVSSNEKDN